MFTNVYLFVQFNDAFCRVRHVEGKSFLFLIPLLFYSLVIQLCSFLLLPTKHSLSLILLLNYAIVPCFSLFTLLMAAFFSAMMQRRWHIYLFSILFSGPEQLTHCITMKKRPRMRLMQTISG